MGKLKFNTPLNVSSQDMRWHVACRVSPVWLSQVITSLANPYATHASACLERIRPLSYVSL